MPRHASPAARRLHRLHLCLEQDVLAVLGEGMGRDGPCRQRQHERTAGVEVHQGHATGRLGRDDFDIDRLLGVSAD